MTPGSVPARKSHSSDGRQTKEEVASTLEAVQNIQSTGQALQKSKESYNAKTVEQERLRKEGATQRDVDKVGRCPSEPSRGPSPPPFLAAHLAARARCGAGLRFKIHGSGRQVLWCRARTNGALFLPSFSGRTQSQKSHRDVQVVRGEIRLRQVGL